MSQYPSPYQPPTPTGPMGSMYGYDPSLDAALAPARRAGILMYVLSAIILLGATCCIGVGAMLPQLMQQQPEAFRQLDDMPEGLTIETIRAVMIGMAIAGIVFAVGMIVLGIFVRKGSTGAIITSMIFTVLAILLLMIWLVASAFDGGRSGAAGAVCIFAIPLALFILLLVWLIQAVRASGQVQAARSQYQQQYWQYAYQQQMHQQPFPQQAPPPPPPGDSNAPPPQG